MDSSIIELMKNVVSGILKDFNPREILLYGSYARGEQNINSDIDLAVIMDNITNDYLDNSARLFLLASNYDTRIETILLSLENDNSGFIEQIKKYGISLYQNHNN